MEKDIHKSDDHKFIPMTSVASRTGQEISSDVYYYTDQIVNIIFIGNPSKDKWILVDAGLPGSTEEIKGVIADRFGEGSKPEAIMLTHGHFDHVGTIVELVKEWQIPIYAHELEFPYLTGKKRYPEPDITVEGGMLAKISAMYPNEPINVGPYVKPLPTNHQVPGLSDWKWVHTPGHTPGHVSFYRESDSLLLSGDAFITVRQDSFYKVLTQQPEVHGPPRYLTTDWKAAKKSVEVLADLNPVTVIPGHGQAMTGKALEEGLNELKQTFDQVAVPDYGRYVNKDIH
ncbi:MBL fold metallo-hydrolase [Ornithinibacillus sp. L9]|uniref:MBL fold metallo-hydrolase n=1 Tax=Ornithinibacillus caprae TaxID=2678566 RepID=A0A6N8FNY0_9BACI|nr:MBL fold metallo-hydrolase [Ornithinibacillus caprae]MUK89807.1 MBL fold metallo-hydrolase [Ornithinibacillus caprae]